MQAWYQLSPLHSILCNLYTSLSGGARGILQYEMWIGQVWKGRAGLLNLSSKLEGIVLW
jgi:hypothetical protein